MSGIDLSKLDYPSVVEEFLPEQIYETMKSLVLSMTDDFGNLLFTEILDSDPSAKILQVMAVREYILRQRVNDGARKVMVAFSGGSDLQHLGALFPVEKLEGESDDDYRNRIILAPDGYSCAGPKNAYVYHALSASSDVKAVKVYQPVPGTTKVVVLSNIGSGAPSAELLTAVEDALNEDEIRPHNDTVVVVGASITEYEVEAELTLYPGIDEDLVLAQAAAAAETHIAWCHAMGKDIIRTALAGTLMITGSVYGVNLIKPAADIIMNSTEAAYCDVTDEDKFKVYAASERQE